MCGLVGVFSSWANGVTGQMTDSFEQLLLVDMLRGFHGTGVMKVNKEGTCFVKKIAGTPLELFYSEKYNNFHLPHKKEVVMALLGHNRHATKGKLIPSHTHPFREGSITLAHNGTLTDWDRLPTPPKEKAFEVDSHALCYSIATIGLQETVNKCTGAMALTWHDADDNTINLYRNSQRPLIIAANKNKQDFMYASEARMLHWIMDRNNQSVISWDFAELPSEMLMSINLGTGEVKKTAVKKSYETNWTSRHSGGRNWSEYEDINEMMGATSVPFEKDKEKVSALGKLVDAAVIAAKIKRQTITKPKLAVNDTGNGRYIQVKELSGYQINDEVVFKLKTYDELKQNADAGYTIVGERPDMPGIQVRSIIPNEKTLKTLMDSEFCAGTVINCMFDQQTPPVDGFKQNILWLRMTHPIAVLDSASDSRGKLCFAKDVSSFPHEAGILH